MALRLISLSQPAPGLSARVFLRSAQGQERFYWRDAHSELVFPVLAQRAAQGLGAGRFVRSNARPRDVCRSWLVHAAG
jgi:hypothetical protein